MFTTLYRVFKYGLQNFSRNYLVSVATILVMLLAVLVFQGLIIFGVIGNQALSTIKDKIDISVDFADSVPEDDILRIKSSIEGLGEVKVVEYVSKDEALNRFRAKHPADSDIAKALEEIESNPLPASLNIKAYDPKGYAVIAKYLADDSFKDSVTNVSYSQNQVVIERLARIMDIGRSAGFILMIVLSVVASVVSFNTILLAIHSNRDEIGIMRLVGASNAFVRGPYIIVGALYGLISAVIAIIFSSPFVFWASPVVRVVIPEFNLWSHFAGNLFTLLGYNLFFAVTIGVVSSIIVVRRYLVG